MSAIHKLKTRPEYFKAVSADEKKFEIRKNDRDFNVGDFLVLREYAENAYTGKQAIFKITYILADPEFLMPEYVALSIQRCTSDELIEFYAIQEGSVQDNEI